MSGPFGLIFFLIVRRVEANELIKMFKDAVDGLEHSRAGSAIFAQTFARQRTVLVLRVEPVGQAIKEVTVRAAPAVDGLFDIADREEEVTIRADLLNQGPEKTKLAQGRVLKLVKEEMADAPVEPEVEIVHGKMRGKHSHGGLDLRETISGSGVTD